MNTREIILGKKVGFQVLSRALAVSAKPTLPHIFISITDSSGKFCHIPANEQRKGLLQIRIDDINDVSRGADYSSKIVFGPAQAAEIASFVREHLTDINLIVLNCDAGRSRSAAVAMALHQWIEGSRGVFSKEFAPNQRIYTMLRNELMRSAPAFT